MQFRKWYYDIIGHKNKADRALQGEPTALREELNMSLSEKSNPCEKGKTSNLGEPHLHFVGC